MVLDACPSQLMTARRRGKKRKERDDMACAHFHPGSGDPVSGITRGLCQCDKYNNNPLRPIPPDGEAHCQLPGASGVNCWLDPYATTAPHVVEVAKDRLGRAFVCLRQGGAWVHEGEHEFPMSLVKS
jgi:hypothetical protein